MQHKDWTKNEAMLAFELYCRTPNGKIGASNQEIVELANMIGRSPSSVSMKMSNFSSVDPSKIELGLRGLPHGSRIDKEIFDEFCTNIGELRFQCEKIFQELKTPHMNSKYTFSEESLGFPAGKEIEIEARQRVGQHYFRKAILSSYNQKCCITGISIPELLIASHIKPWRASNEINERTNPCNGLCLNALHDKAFDEGLITITKEYRIIVSQKLKARHIDESTVNWIVHYDGQLIQLPKRFFPDKKFIEYHNDCIFER